MQPRWRTRPTPTPAGPSTRRRPATGGAAFGGARSTRTSSAAPPPRSSRPSAGASQRKPRPRSPRRPRRRRCFRLHPRRRRCRPRRRRRFRRRHQPPPPPALPSTCPDFGFRERPRLLLGEVTGEWCVSISKAECPTAYVDPTGYGPGMAVGQPYGFKCTAGCAPCTYGVNPRTGNIACHGAIGNVTATASAPRRAWPRATPAWWARPCAAPVSAWSPAAGRARSRSPGRATTQALGTVRVMGTTPVLGTPRPTSAHAAPRPPLAHACRPHPRPRRRLRCCHLRPRHPRRRCRRHLPRRPPRRCPRCAPTLASASVPGSCLGM